MAVAHHLPLLRLTEHLEVGGVVHCDPVNHEGESRVVLHGPIGLEEESRVGHFCPISPAEE